MIIEFLVGFGILIGYYLIAASLAALLHKTTKIPSEVSRKTLHLICTMSVFVFLNAFKNWYIAVLAAIAFILVVYPILSLFENFKMYKLFLSERKGGEVKRSMILAIGMIAILITIFWGWAGRDWKYIIIVAVMAWGFGDAAAALIGKSVGRNFIKAPLVDGKKTFEGTFSMLIVSFLAIYVTTLVYDVAPWHICMIIAFIAAPVSAIVELISHNGCDTLTVPISTGVLVFALVYIIRLLGV